MEFNIFEIDLLNLLLKRFEDYKRVLGLEKFFDLKSDERDDLLKEVFARTYNPNTLEQIEKTFSRRWVTSKFYVKNSDYCIKLREKTTNGAKPIRKVVKARIAFELKDSYGVVVSVDRVKTTADNESIELDPTSKEKNYMYDHARIISGEVEDELFIKIFVQNFYDVLHEKNLTEATGSEAIWMREIYINAKEHFPDFGECSKANQYRILKNGYYTGRRYGSDIYKLSKSTFFQLEKEGLIDNVSRLNTLIDKNVNYHLLYEHRQGNSTEENSLIWLQYGYKAGSTYLETSFHVSDVWNLLHNEATERLSGF